MQCPPFYVLAAHKEKAPGGGRHRCYVKDSNRSILSKKVYEAYLVHRHWPREGEYGAVLGHFLCHFFDDDTSDLCHELLALRLPIAKHIDRCVHDCTNGGHDQQTHLLVERLRVRQLGVGPVKEKVNRNSRTLLCNGHKLLHKVAVGLRLLHNALLHVGVRCEPLQTHCCCDCEVNGLFEYNCCSNQNVCMWCIGFEVYRNTTRLTNESVAQTESTLK